MELMIGNFATSKAGHDKDKCYVIVGEDGEFVYLSDGRLKKLEAPKRKRKKHIQIINCTIDGELLKKLIQAENGKTSDSTDADTHICNEEIKYEIKQYLRQLRGKGGSVCQKVM